MNISKTGGKTPLEAWRLYAFMGVISFVFSIFILRLFYLQVLEHDNWSRRQKKTAPSRLACRRSAGSSTIAMASSWRVMWLHTTSW